MPLENERNIKKFDKEKEKECGHDKHAGDGQTHTQNDVYFLKGHHHKQLAVSFPLSLCVCVCVAIYVDWFGSYVRRDKTSDVVDVVAAASLLLPASQPALTRYSYYSSQNKIKNTSIKSSSF